MSNISTENKQSIADTEISDTGVVHKPQKQDSVSALKTTPSQPSLTELNLAIERANTVIDKLIKENESLKATVQSNNSNSQDTTAYDNLAKALEKVLYSNKPVQVPENDGINRTTDYTTSLTMDRNSLMEAQQSLVFFKNEAKKPINIPKSFKDSFGPYLAITVNGVRIAIPVDGRTYYINETHWEHAKERIAKVDKRLSDNEPKVVEIDA